MLTIVLTSLLYTAVPLKEFPPPAVLLHGREGDIGIDYFSLALYVHGQVSTRRAGDKQVLAVGGVPARILQGKGAVQRCILQQVHCSFGVGIRSKGKDTLLPKGTGYL
jgi:hypothetical protein